MMKNSGQALISILISLGLVAILMLGLSSLHSLTFKSQKNTELEFESQLEQSRFQYYLSDLNGACRNNFGGQSFLVTATDLGGISQLVDKNGTPFLQVGTVLSSGLRINSIRLAQLTALNGTSYKGDLEIVYRKEARIQLGALDLKKVIPIFLNVDTVTTPGTVIILDCAATTSTLTTNLQNLCTIIEDTLGNHATWDTVHNKCIFP